MNGGPNASYTYGSLNILTLPVGFCYNDFRHLIAEDKLIISLNIYAIEFDETADEHEIKLYWNPNDDLVNDLRRLLYEPKYSDLTIFCSGEALKAHKCILAGW